MKARSLLIFVVMGFSFLLAGCKGEVRVENMTITNPEAKPKGYTQFTDNIVVESVFLNEPQNPMLGNLGLNNQNFREALTTSLRTAKLLAQDGKGLFTLKAHMVRNTPEAFGNLVSVQYTLIRKQDNKKIYSKLISSEGKAEFGDTAAFPLEGAIRNNFAMLIDKLYALK